MQNSFYVYAEARGRLIPDAGHSSMGDGRYICCRWDAEVYAAVGARHRALHLEQFLCFVAFGLWREVREPDLLGVIELTTAALLAAGAFNPIASAIGALMGIQTFCIAWSFFFSTPGVIRWSLSTDPIAWDLAGEFLFKDIMLSLSHASFYFSLPLPRKFVPLRSS